ncbi:MAG: D-aminoacyl-tRNA deacylase [Chlamydiae bacterium]|nr:D-aminoacyl-tRNA deacylase [Chlamydiota bacterium]
MRLILQRVSNASVSVNEKIVGQIGPGILALLGIHKEDTPSSIAPLIEKLINLRIFQDTAGKMNFSLLDTGGDLLIVSQFTLYADCRSGRRPSFVDAAPPEKAKVLYEKFVAIAKEKVKTVETGEFGVYMQVELINDGPVTMLLNSAF